MSASRTFMDRGVCRSMPDDATDLFFPERVDFDSDAAFEMAVNAAKKECRRCTVSSECLAYALATGQEYGIWGGYTDAERQNLLSRAAASRGGVPA